MIDLAESMKILEAFKVEDFLHCAFQLINMSMSLGGSWRGNPRCQGENMQTPHWGTTTTGNWTRYTTVHPHPSNLNN